MFLNVEAVFSLCFALVLVAVSGQSLPPPGEIFSNQITHQRIAVKSLSRNAPSYVH